MVESHWKMPYKQSGTFSNTTLRTATWLQDVALNILQGR